MNENIEICLAHSLRRADRVVSQIYNDYLAPVGLRATQFSVLRALSIMGKTTASQIQEVLILDQTTVSRVLKPLIRDNYIAVSAGVNKREKALSLSKDGEALYQRALVPWREAQAMLKKRLEGQDQQLIKLSATIVNLKN